MKHLRFFSLILFLCFLLGNTCVEALAFSEGFSTEALTQEEIDTFLANVGLSVLSKEPAKKKIDCFDVNENGLIAVGCSDFEKKTVCIYTSEGNFEYGYEFQCSGAFGVEIKNDHLIIYFVRSDVKLVFDFLGHIMSISKIQNTSENNSYWNNFVYETRREVDGNIYHLTNKMRFFNVFASSYSQLIITDMYGASFAVYDTNSINYSILILPCAGLVMLSTLIYKLKKLKRSV